MVNKKLYAREEKNLAHWSITLLVIFFVFSSNWFLAILEIVTEWF